MAGLFLEYQRIRFRSLSGQVATLFILLIAVIFIFMAVTINLGKLASVKTSLDNAADGASLSVASLLGSFSSVREDQEGCVTNPLGIIRVIVGIIFIISGVNVLGGIMLIGKTFYAEGTKDYALKKMFRELSTKSEATQIRESGIFYALSALVEDPNLVPDVNDIDEDGVFNEDIPEFTDWYYKRVVALDTGSTDALENFANTAGFDTARINLDAMQRILVGQGADHGFQGDIDGETGNETAGVPGDFDYYFRVQFVPLLRALMALYTSDPTKFAVIAPQIHKPEGGFWLDGNCDFTKYTALNPYDPANISDPCDNADALAVGIGTLSQILTGISKLVDSGYGLWSHGSTIMAILYGEPDAATCVGGVTCRSKREQIDAWKTWADDWRVRLETILNAEDPVITAGLGSSWPLFPSQDYCHLNACDDRCNLMASDPMFDCNIMAPVTLPVNYMPICEACKSSFFRPWQICATECADTFMHSMTSNLLNDTVICSACTGTCPWIGSCCQRAGYDCLECIGYTQAGIGLCWTENRQPGPCPKGPGSEGCVEIADQPALDNCRAGCKDTYMGNFYNCCVSRCMDECYKPVREDIVKAIAMLQSFSNRLASLGPVMDTAKNSLDAISGAAFTAFDKALYGWKDSLGWHLIEVRVSPVKIPKMDYYSKDWGFTDCTRVLCKYGSIGVWAWRYDQAKESKFAGRNSLPLWNFRYRRNVQNNATEPTFMEAKDSWLQLTAAEKAAAESFLRTWGLRAYSEAYYGPDQNIIKLISTQWRDPNDFMACNEY